MKTKTAKRPTAKSAKRPSTFVKVKIWTDVLPMVRALAAVRTESDGERCTEAYVLEDALIDGLTAMEKRYLGSMTLDDSAPEPPETEGDYIEKNAVTRVLAKAFSTARGGP